MEEDQDLPAAKRICLDDSAPTSVGNTEECVRPEGKRNYVHWEKNWVNLTR